MDRSFLSQPEVIAASRSFVYVRLTTYESKEEMAFLKSFEVTRSGEVENTVFCILAPDGKRRLSRAGRSTRRSFRDAADLAETMKRIAKDYPGAKKPGLPALPVVANVRLAVNVAACDNQPLAVVFAAKKDQRKTLEQRVAQLTADEKFVGRFIFAATSEARELKTVTGVPANGGLLVIQADRYGTKGKVLAHAPPDSDLEDLSRTLQRGADRHEPVVDKTFRSHVREGQQLGVFWETLVPVTDPMEKQARERGRKRAADR
jgi:hypothetical protein